MTLWPFTRKPTPSDSARILSHQGHLQRRERVRTKVDAMRLEMGMEPVRWPR